VLSWSCLSLGLGIFRSCFGVAWVMSGSCLDGLVVVVSDLFWHCLVACLSVALGMSA